MSGWQKYQQLFGCLPFEKKRGDKTAKHVAKVLSESPVERYLTAGIADVPVEV